MVANHPDMPAPPNPHRLKLEAARVSSGVALENPKQSEGSKKVGMHVIPPSVMMQVALALTEGELRYSGYNWRETPVKASTYYDSTWRHISDWWEGQDIDAPSGLSNVIKAIAGLIVLADAMQQGQFIDDRPKAHVNPNWMEDANKQHVALVANVKAKLEADKC